MDMKKRLRAIEDALERVDDGVLRLVGFYEDDTPEMREAILKEAKERLPKRRKTDVGPDLMIITFRSKEERF